VPEQPTTKSNAAMCSMGPNLSSQATILSEQKFRDWS